MLLSGEWSEEKWVGNEISHIPPLQLKSDHALLNHYKNHLCTLSWQLEQLEMKKTIEFETLSRKYSNQVMPSLRRSCRDLHRLDSDGPLILWQSLVQETEEKLESCRQSVGDLARIRELQSKKEILSGVLRLGKVELEWRKLIEVMEIAMQEMDFDAAQASLEKLDEQLKSIWKQHAQKGEKVDELRNRLIHLIKST